MHAVVWSFILTLVFASTAQAQFVEVPINQLIAGQAIYSQQKVDEKIEGRRRNGISEIDTIETPQGELILDGHNEAMIAYQLGYKTVWVKRDAQLSAQLHDLSPLSLWQRLWNHKRVYFFGTTLTPQQLALNPVHIPQLVDEPFLYLATALARKLEHQVLQNGDIEEFVRGPENAIWMKDARSPHMIEVEMVNIFRAAGVERMERWPKPIPPHIVEQARAALLAAQYRNEILDKPEFEKLQHVELLGRTAMSCTAAIRGQNF
jgi:hypothetical protein